MWSFSARVKQCIQQRIVTTLKFGVFFGAILWILFLLPFLPFPFPFPLFLPFFLSLLDSDVGREALRRISIAGGNDPVGSLARRGSIAPPRGDTATIRGAPGHRGVCSVRHCSTELPLAPWRRVSKLGLPVTDTGGMVTVAEAFLLGSAWLVAVTAPLAGVDRAAGAV